jgi:hypothetical protein
MNDQQGSKIVLISITDSLSFPGGAKVGIKNDFRASWCESRIIELASRGSDKSAIPLIDQKSPFFY